MTRSGTSLLLALDTSGPTLSLGLFEGDTADLTHEEIGRGHAERLPVLLRERLDALSLDVRAVSRIAVVSGPGSFAGLRAGLAFGRGLGLGLGVPVVGVPLAEALARGREGRTVVALDMRRDEVWWQVFEDGAAGGGERLSVNAASQRLSETSGTLVGSAAVLLERSDADHPIVQIDRDALLRNVAALATAATAQARPPRPLYARGADAKPPRPPVVSTAERAAPH